MEHAQSGADIDTSTVATDDACGTAATSEDEDAGVGAFAQTSDAEVIEQVPAANTAGEVPLAHLVAPQPVLSAAASLRVDTWPKQPSENASSSRVDPWHTAIIFDWDDTLLPTSFMEDAVKICPIKCGPPARLSSHGRSSSRSLRGRCVGKDFPCYAALRRHAELVRRVLTRASGLGRVAIVTSASRPWVLESAETYLPEVGLAGFLRDLKIPVYYADEHRRPRAGSDSLGEELDRQSAMKRNAMSEFLRCGSASPDDQQGCTNILSIGDSAAEMQAAKAVAGAVGRPEPRRCLCKTVKLMCDPSLKQLSDQLQTLEGCLEALASRGVDLDLCASEPAELAEQAAALLGI